MTTNQVLDFRLARQVGAVDPLAQIPRYIDHAVARAATAHRSTFVEIAQSLDQLAALEDVWRRLQAADGRGTAAFQSYDWCYQWARTYCPPTGISPFVAVVYDNDEAVLIWPLMTTCAGPFCILRWLSDPFGQYGDVIAAPGINMQRYLELAWREIVSKTAASAVRMRHVRSDARCYDFLQTICECSEPPDLAPSLDLRQFSSLEAYDARYSKAQRRRRRQIRDRLRTLGEVSFHSLDEPGHMDNLAETIIGEKNAWLNRKGNYSESLSTPQCADFLKALAKHSTADFKFVTSVLCVAGNAISYEIALRCAGRHLCFITAHNHRLTDLSPGRFHMHLAQRQAIADGCEVFDLMVPGDTYKQSWSDGATEVRDFHTALNARGKIFATGFLKTARPLLRKLYHTAPTSLRRKVVPLFR